MPHPCVNPGQRVKHQQEPEQRPAAARAPVSGFVPDFVTVGNAARDVIPGGWRLGGTIAFAAAQADRLGLRAGVVTRAPVDMEVAGELPFATVVCRSSDRPTSFENVYNPEGRIQRLLSQAGDLEIADVPEAWLAAPVALLGPVFGEIDPEMASAFSATSLVGVSAQGWVRAADTSGRVRHQAWTGAPYWAGASVLFASDEDLAGDEAELDRWVTDVPVVAVTRSSRGARVFVGGRVLEMGAYPAVEVDATGAGDTFATAFLVRYHETNDVAEAARFGAAAASLSVEGIGTSSMGDRAAIEGRIAAHPHIRLS